VAIPMMAASLAVQAPLGFNAHLLAASLLHNCLPGVAQPARADLRAAEKQLFGIFSHIAQAYWNIKVFGATRGDMTIARNDAGE
jgi:hypothetical protein